MQEHGFKKENKQLKGILFASTTALLWSFLTIALKISSTFIDTSTVIWSRFSIASIILIILTLTFKPSNLNILKAPPLMSILAGFLLGANYYGFMLGVELTNTSNTQILIQLGPIFLVIVSIFIFQEKISLLNLAGFILALVGFSFFYQNQLQNFLSNSSQYMTGNLWIVFAAITWTLFAVFQKFLVKKYSPQEINLIVYLVPSLFFVFAADLDVFARLNIKEWFMVLYLGLNTVVAYGCLGEALKHLEATKVSIIITLNPILTFIFLETMNHFKLDLIPHETMNEKGYFGAFLVILGSIFVVGFKKKPQLEPILKTQK